MKKQATANEKQVVIIPLIVTNVLSLLKSDIEIYNNWKEP
jgi:hypothetical protein